MLVLLSPAKSLDMKPNGIKSHTKPLFVQEAVTLATRLKNMPKKDIKKLMKISDSLVDINMERYRSFEEKHHSGNSKQAVLCFNGDVYLGLKAKEWDETDHAFAQSSIRILSGMYGILRPLDYIQAYRLEMGSSLKYRNKKNLYQFWGDKIDQQINKDVRDNEHEAIVNLASQEYFDAVHPENLDKPVYNIHFRELKDGEWSFISFNAKRARGILARYIVKHRLENITELKKFDDERYQFNPELSSDHDWYFTREFIKAGS